MSTCAFDSEKLRTESVHFFNSETVEALIADFQHTCKTETLGEIITRCQPLSLSLVRSRRSFRFEDEDELLSVVNRKLLVSVPQYDRARGSAFSFVSKLCLNQLCTVVTLKKKLARRYEALTETVIHTTPDSANFESQIAVDDLAQQIRRLIRSMCILESERQARCWFVESFLDCHFSMRRHQSADAAMKVFGLLLWL